MSKTIYNLALHEILITSECDGGHSLFTTVMRVPGGWIYRSYDKSCKIMSCVFVPLDREFKEAEE